MKSLLFDTNALLYWAYPSSPFHGEVAALLDRALRGRVRIYALASSLNDVYYVLRKHYGAEQFARGSIARIAETFDLIDLSGTLVWHAIDSDEPDYEDGLIRAAAETLQVDALITYDAEAFQMSFVPAMSAQAALARGGP